MRQFNEAGIFRDIVAWEGSEMFQNSLRNTVNCAIHVELVSC